MAVTSRIEQARDEIKAEYATITTAAGYRTSPTVRGLINPIDRVSKSPEIGVEVGAILLEPTNAAWTVYDILADIWVQGAIQASTDVDGDATNLKEAAEALRHDILRKTTEMTNKYLTHTGSRWHITVKRPIKFSTVQLLGANRNTGAFYCTFTIRVKSMDNTFLYAVSAGADGPSADVVIDAGTQ